MKSSAQPKRNITGKLAQTPSVSLRARLTLTGAIVVVATAFVTATASADSINYNLGHQTYTWGDCTLVVGYVQDPNPSLHHGPAGVYGWAAIGGLTINCSSRHASIPRPSP